MKTINFLLILFFLCSLTSQEDVAAEIKNQFFTRIKQKLLDKRGNYDYYNDILVPINTESKRFILDRVEANDAKINEVINKYSLDPKILPQIKLAFLASQPNVYTDIDFSLSAQDKLNQVVDNAEFKEYFGYCLKKDNMVNYMILSITINAKILEKFEVSEKWCKYFVFGDFFKKYAFDENKCPDKEHQLILYRRRSLNNNEKAQANDLIRAYSGEIFKLMIDQQQESITIPENLGTQSVFTTGQVFKNGTSVQAEITSYGDVEIKANVPLENHILLTKNCEGKTVVPFLGGCFYSAPCYERKSEYLVADKDGESSCTKLKELKKEKKQIQMIVYNDGSLGIKSSGGNIFYGKPNVQGKGPFTVGVTKELELQVVDSQNVVVWKSTPALVHHVR